MQQTVLLIDDAPEIHDLIEIRLRAPDLRLVHALDGSDGLSQARECSPDLILLDMDMPGMSGLDVCRHLKSDARTAPVPVIFLTGASNTNAKISGLDAGAIDYVTKPCDADELKARVRAALRTKRYHDQLSERAQVDALTGLFNRGTFDRRLREELDTARRERRALSLVLGDIDHFKVLNDTFGHPVGDEALRRVAASLSGNVRACDFVFRYGGEEFAILLPSTCRAGARMAAERVRAAVARVEVCTEPRSLFVTCSFGIASLDDIPPGGDAIALVRAADERLYQAKKSGRNRVCG